MSVCDVSLTKPSGNSCKMIAKNVITITFRMVILMGKMEDIDVLAPNFDINTEMPTSTDYP